MITNEEFRELILELLGEDYDWYSLNEKAGRGMGIKTPKGYLTILENSGELDAFGDKIDYFVYQINDQKFRVDGWSDSWGDAGEMYWEQAYEVVQRAVTRYEYLPKSEGDQNV